MSDQSDPTDRDTGGAEAVLVRTTAADPVAALDAASVDRDDGPVLGVLAAVPREGFERWLVEAGYDQGAIRSLDFAPSTDSAGPTAPGDGRRVHGDVAGLSMALVRRLDGLAEEDGIVYFESLEPFIHRAGLEPTLRFLVIVASRARAAGVPLAVRLDPGAVGQPAVETLSEAFDRAIEGPSDGSSGGAGASE